jgi:cytochrome b561
VNVEWLLIRGSGLVAYVLLAGSTIWGLLITTKLLGRAAKPKGVSWFHESLGIASVLATMVHMAVLSVHEYIEFSWSDILIPGRSEWEPLATAFGVMAFYGSFLISVSFYVKRFIGQQAWRAIHFGSLGVFVSALIHGITAGTDTQEPWVTAVYASTGAIVVILVVARVAQEMGGSERPGRRPAPASADDAPPARRPERPAVVIPDHLPVGAEPGALVPRRSASAAEQAATTRLAERLRNPVDR